MSFPNKLHWFALIVSVIGLVSYLSYVYWPVKTSLVWNCSMVVQTSKVSELTSGCVEVKYGP